MSYVFANYVLPIFDVTGDFITLNSAGQTVYHIRNVVTITTSDRLSNYGASPPREVPQPAMTIRISAPIYFVTSQAVTTPQSPTTNPRFPCTPGCINRKIIYYETKAGKALYKQATRLIYPDSEGKFSLTS